VGKAKYVTGSIGTRSERCIRAHYTWRDATYQTANALRCHFIYILESCR